MKTITISRQYGSGGREIAKMLSEEIGIPFYDSDLLAIASEKYGISPGLMAEYDERKSSSFLYGIAMLADGITSQEKIMLPYKLFQAQKEGMIRLAEEGPCIFVGRCADYILKEQKRILKVYVYCSSMEKRINRIMERDKVSQREAPGRIAQRDRERKDYYYFHTGQEWGDMKNYDIGLNTAMLSYKDCTKVIRNLLQEKG